MLSPALTLTAFYYNVVHVRDWSPSYSLYSVLIILYPSSGFWFEMFGWWTVSWDLNLQLLPITVCFGLCENVNRDVTEWRLSSSRFLAGDAPQRLCWGTLSSSEGFEWFFFCDCAVRELCSLSLDPQPDEDPWACLLSRNLSTLQLTTLVLQLCSHGNRPQKWEEQWAKVEEKTCWSDFLKSPHTPFLFLLVSYHHSLPHSLCHSVRLSDFTSVCGQWAATLDM